MKCPIDGAELVMADRSGVEIDYCPSCRGVWLDRGELDKIIERSGSGIAPASHDASRGREARRGSEQRYSDEPKKKKKLGGFLEDIFDF